MYIFIVSGIHYHRYSTVIADCHVRIFAALSPILGDEFAGDLGGFSPMSCVHFSGGSEKADINQ